MDQRAAGGRVESFDRRFHGLGPEPVLIEGPGRTNRLRAQQPAAAGNLFAGTDRRRPGIRQALARLPGAGRQNPAR